MKEKWDNHWSPTDPGDIDSPDLDNWYDVWQNAWKVYGFIKSWHAEQHDGKSPILDAGAGTGNLTIELAKRCGYVTAIDTDNKALEILKKKCKPYDNVKILNMDVQNLTSPDETYAGVCSMFVYPNAEDHSKSLSEAYRVLQEGGLFTITAWASVPDFEKINEELYKPDLIEEGILPKYEMQWEAAKEEDKVRSKKAMKNELTQSQLEEQLKAIGFKDIEFPENNPLQRYGYSCVCRK